MTESTDAKRTLKLKKIFSPQLTPLRTNGQHGLPRAESRPLVISAPILQHSSSIYSLVSPTRSLPSENGWRKGQDTQPCMLSPPATPSPRPWKGSNVTHTSSAPGMQEMTATSPTSSPWACPFSRHMLAHSALAAHYHRIQNLTERISSLPPTPSTSALRKRAEQKGLIPDHGMPDPLCEDSFIRRHSCSSTACRVSSGTKQKRVAPGASPAATAAAFAAMPSRPPIPMQSKSTPLHKVKTYNVHGSTPQKRPSPKVKQPQEIEQQRKMQELEELISGRRGSTLKFSLTPKVVS